MANRAWIVGDDAESARQLRLGLEGKGWEVRGPGSAEEALAALAASRPDLVIAACRSPERDALALLRATLALDRGTRVVLVIDRDDVQVAVDAIRAGAHHCLVRPIASADLEPLLDQTPGLGGAGQARRLPGIEAADGGISRFIGVTPLVEAVRTTVRRVLEAERDLAGGDLPAILISGETGTGKGLVARALHFDGLRRDGPFVEINCASIPSNLLETELFGHERGAFTDAKDRKPGLVEAAEGGTLFLDEIGEVDPAIQAKLLKLLEEKTVRRIGSVRERKANIRIISASNRDLGQLVRYGRFRSDLYFRLRIISIALPPLRERGEDVLILARHFLQAHGKRYGKHDLMLSPEAERLMASYSWPGNVRELRNVLEQTVLLARERLIHPGQIAIPVSAAPRPVAPPLRETHYANAVHPRQPAEAAARFARDGTKLCDAERELLMMTLDRTDWNISKAARFLGLTRDTLRTRIVRLGLMRGSPV